MQAVQNLQGFQVQAMESSINDLKVYRCTCKAPVKIAAHKDGLYILQCPKCGTEYTFCDDHPYFNHENARAEIGDYVIFEGFKPKEKLHSCRACGAPITKEQAVRTFEDQGRALCGQCE